MPRAKDDFTAGLETILNNPKLSFMKNPKTFREVHSQSGMPISEMIRHVGKTSKVKHDKPTDDDKSKARLETLEAHSAADAKK